ARAIHTGTRDPRGVVYEAVSYDASAPGGVALLGELLPPNKNRTAGEIRAIFTKHGGHLAGVGAVKHLFHRKGQFLISKDQIAEDDLITLALDAGAEDVQAHAENYE